MDQVLEVLEKESLSVAVPQSPMLEWLQGDSPECIGEALAGAEQTADWLEEVYSLLESGSVSADSPQYWDDTDAGSEWTDGDEALNEDPLAGVEPDDAVSLYFREMVREPLLSAQEEADLGRAIERGNVATRRLSSARVTAEEWQELDELVRAADEARSRLIRANTQLVVSIAKKYRGYGVPFLDLIQEGNLGLMKAVEKYDYRRGYRFSTYATWWIRQAVVRAMPTQGRTIRLPLQMSERIRRMRRASHSMEQKLGRQPTSEEIAEEMGIDLDQVECVMQAASLPISLDQPVGEDGESELGDFVTNQLAGASAEAYRRQLLTEGVSEALAMLPSREAQILSLRFGLGGGRSYTLKEIGEELGLTRERIRQIQNAALQRLRRVDATHALRDYLA